MENPFAHHGRKQSLPPVEQLPHRPRQAPPTDPVQAQLRLMAMAVQSLSEAVSGLDRLRYGGRSQDAHAVVAARLVHQVAELGGWVESTLPTGVPLRDGDGWVVLDPDPAGPPCT